MGILVHRRAAGAHCKHWMRIGMSAAIGWEPNCWATTVGPNVAQQNSGHEWAAVCCLLAGAHCLSVCSRRVTVCSGALGKPGRECARVHCARAASSSGAAPAPSRHSIEAAQECPAVCSRACSSLSLSLAVRAPLCASHSSCVAFRLLQHKPRTSPMQRAPPKPEARAPSGQH